MGGGPSSMGYRSLRGIAQAPEHCERWFGLPETLGCKI